MAATEVRIPCAPPLLRATLAASWLLTGCVAMHPPPATSPAGSACGPELVGHDQVRESVVFVGEIHGTNEFPEAFARLVCQAVSKPPLSRTLVALEFPARMQPAIDAFVDGGSERARAALTQDAFFQRNYQDGRSSAAMLRLLESLRQQRVNGLKIEVRGIDVDEAQQGEQRDARMAQNLTDAISAVRPERTFVLLGNVHSRNLPGYPWAPGDPFRSAAVRFMQSFQDVAAIDLKTTGGTAWTCLASDCASHELPSRPAAGPIGQLSAPAKAQSGFDWVLNVGPVTASPPLKDTQIPMQPP